MNENEIICRMCRIIANRNKGDEQNVNSMSFNKPTEGVTGVKPTVCH